MLTPDQVRQLPVKFVQPGCEAPEQVCQLLPVGFQKLEGAATPGYCCQEPCATAGNRSQRLPSSSRAVDIRSVS